MVPTTAKIRLLSDATANKIAAGEVVQRPASVAKELLENALDAGATTLKLVIEDGGKTLIQLVDNGCGMNEVDARMAFERHATSKINEAEDLYRLSTYGFRGEALASIAAVAQVELLTKEQGAPLGTRVVIEGSHLKKQEVVSAPQGTNLAVRYLFGNVPARRNFLKSNSIEAKHILDEFSRVALARPDVRMDLYQNGRLLHQLPPAKLSHRIIHLFGKGYEEQLVPCEEETDTLKLSGYIGTPKQAKKGRHHQFFFVNGRYIRSAYFHHAVKQAFEPLLPAEAAPFYVLFIEAHPGKIDVNIHPTKTEVKFEQENIVYATLAASVKKAIAQHHFTPAIDFESGTHHAFFALGESAPAPTSPPLTKTFHMSAEPTPLPLKAETLPTAAPLHTANPAPAQNSPSKLQLHQRYILTQVKSGLLVVDQVAAYERILYERNLNHLNSQPSNTQQLLFPTKLELSPTHQLLVEEYKEPLHKLGFRFQIKGKHLTLTAQPPNTRGGGTATELIELLEECKSQLSTNLLPPKEVWARAMAKRGSNKVANKPLNEEEIDSILDQLFNCQTPHHTPTGARVWHIIPLHSLEDALRTP